MDLFEDFNDRELLVTNIQFLGLVQNAWEFSRGARTERIYTCPDTPGFVHVKDIYTYVMTNGDRDVDTYTRKIQWFRTDETVGLEKDITPVLNIKNKKTLNKRIYK